MKKLKYLSLIVLSAFSISVLKISAFSSATLTEESEVLVEQLKAQIKGTMLAIGKNEAQAGHAVEDLNLTIELPAKNEVNLGILLDVDSPNEGFKILSVSPGSTAEKLALQVGTSLVSFNETPVKESTSAAILDQIQMLSAGDKVKFSTSNGSKISQYETMLEGRFMPDIKLVVGAESGAGTGVGEFTQVGSNSCGFVSVFFSPPQTKDLYPSYINKIDDRSTIKSRHSFKLSAATHKVYVHELINDPSLKRKRRGINKSKLLELTIEPNKTYHIAAKFDRNKKSRRFKEEYWEPVVWKVTDNKCEL